LSELMRQSDVSRIMAKPILLRRVLVNLILDVVQAMSNGGKLTITVGRTEESVALTVQDIGTWISHENLGKIFNPFFTTKAKGQGLGLAVCKRLVEAQGGVISVRSELGKESAFTILLPTGRTSGAT